MPFSLVDFRCFTWFWYCALTFDLSFFRLLLNFVYGHAHLCCNLESFDDPSSFTFEEDLGFRVAEALYVSFLDFFDLWSWACVFHRVGWVAFWYVTIVTNKSILLCKIHLMCYIKNILGTQEGFSILKGSSTKDTQSVLVTENFQS